MFAAGEDQLCGRGSAWFRGTQHRQILINDGETADGAWVPSIRDNLDITLLLPLATSDYLMGAGAQGIYDADQEVCRVVEGRRLKTAPLSGQEALIRRDMYVGQGISLPSLFFFFAPVQGPKLPSLLGPFFFSGGWCHLEQCLARLTTKGISQWGRWGMVMPWAL